MYLCGKLVESRRYPRAILIDTNRNPKFIFIPTRFTP